MARITEATLVVRWEDGGTHELVLNEARNLRVQRVRHWRLPWQRAREDLVVTFIAAGPSGTFVGAPCAVEVQPTEAPDWPAHIASLPREDRSVA